MFATLILPQCPCTIACCVTVYTLSNGSSKTIPSYPFKVRPATKSLSLNNSFFQFGKKSKIQQQQIHMSKQSKPKQTS